MNAKLANRENKGQAWTISPSDLGCATAGLTWCDEVKTMVLGISISNSVGSYDSYSVISVSATVDSSCMNFAQAFSVCTRTEIIDDKILSSLTKVSGRTISRYHLANSFVKFTNQLLCSQ